MEEVNYQRKLAAIGWPYNEKPGCCIVLGEDVGHTTYFLSIAESNDIMGLYEKTTKLWKDVGFQDLIGDTHNELYSLWEELFNHDFALPFIQPRYTPGVISITFAQQIIMKYLTEKKLVVTEWVQGNLPDYLLQLTVEDSEKAKPEHYPAMIALTYALLEIEKNPVNPFDFDDEYENPHDAPNGIEMR